MLDPSIFFYSSRCDILMTVTQLEEGWAQGLAELNLMKQATSQEHLVTQNANKY